MKTRPVRLPPWAAGRQARDQQPGGGIAEPGHRAAPSTPRRRTTPASRSPPARRHATRRGQARARHDLGRHRSRESRGPSGRTGTADTVGWRAQWRQQQPRGRGPTKDPSASARGRRPATHGPTRRDPPGPARKPKPKPAPATLDLLRPPRHHADDRPGAAGPGPGPPPGGHGPGRGRSRRRAPGQR